MNEDELKRIEERCTATSAGPWDNAFVGVAINVFASSHPLESFTKPIPLHPRTMDDAEFIAASRSDVPALIAEIRRLQELVDGGMKIIMRLTENEECCYD